MMVKRSRNHLILAKQEVQHIRTMEEVATAQILRVRGQTCHLSHSTQCRNFSDRPQYCFRTTSSSLKISHLKITFLKLLWQLSSILSQEATIRQTYRACLSLSKWWTKTSSTKQLRAWLVTEKQKLWWNRSKSRPEWACSSSSLRGKPTQQRLERLQVALRRKWCHIKVVITSSMTIRRLLKQRPLQRTRPRCRSGSTTTSKTSSAI